MVWTDFLKILIFSIFFNFGCQSNKTITGFEVTSYTEVTLDYKYSKDILKYDGKYFKPKLKERYEKGELIFATVFKSEGALVYSKSDLDADSLLAKSIDLKYNRQISIKNGHIIDNADEFNTFEKNNGNYYCFSQSGLNIYTFNK